MAVNYNQIISKNYPELIWENFDNKSNYNIGVLKNLVYEFKKSKKN